MVRSSRRPVLRLAAALLLSLSLAACGDDDTTADDTPGEPTGELTVLAASSLTEAFEAVAAAFEAEHDGVDVHLSFDASSALATQVEEGVPADVFASADEVALARVRDAGLVAGRPVVIATNRLQIAVPAGNPASVDELADLAGGLRLALCAPEVPCGRYAAELFANAGLEVPEASQEESARGVLTKVALGEADAGIVYVTDVQASAGVEGVAIPDADHVVASYPATVLDAAPNPAAAAAFLAFLTGWEAQAVLRDAGFGPPAP